MFRGDFGRFVALFCRNPFSEVLLVLIESEEGWGPAEKFETVFVGERDNVILSSVIYLDGDVAESSG